MKLLYYWLRIIKEVDAVVMWTHLRAQGEPHNISDCVDIPRVKSPHHEILNMVAR